MAGGIGEQGLAAQAAAIDYDNSIPFDPNIELGVEYDEFIAQLSEAVLRHRGIAQARETSRDKAFRSAEAILANLVRAYSVDEECLVGISGEWLEFL